MIRIGTRTSKLALIQTDIVKMKILQAIPNERVEIVPVETQGDQELNRSLASFGGKGVFTKELEQQLLDGTIDIAVHSAKDVPMQLPDGLCIGAVLKREDSRDVLVTRTGVPARYLAPGSVIGTGSLRRELQMKHCNPQVIVKGLRGNVPTRLQKLRDGEYDGIVLAAAGLQRLGMDHEPGLEYEYMDQEEFLPAAGQGILALEIRKGTLEHVMQVLNDAKEAFVLEAERAFLAALDGSCNAPCGALCEPAEDGYLFRGMYAADGEHPVYVSAHLEAGDTDAVVRLAQGLQDKLAANRVSLVGAGPGEEACVSQKALECVRKADVIVYDHLIPSSLLNEARMDAELLYVGKRAGAHSKKQEEINQILIQRSQEGKYVVRLKGGDPFIFGRGAEEALALKEKEIPFEIVPGISSAYSVPALFGIPVTHRGMASSVHIITGHRKEDGAQESIPYEALVKEKATLVFLMGLKHLPEIISGLLAAGMDRNVPAAVIQKGYSAQQKMVTGTVAAIEVKVQQSGIETPAIIVVGEVVSLAAELSWQQEKPLTGKRIMLTGTRSVVHKLQQELQPLGAQTDAISLIETHMLENERTDKIIQHPVFYQWIVFMSISGVDVFFDSLNRLKVDRRKLALTKFAVVGDATAQRLNEYGYQYDFKPSKSRSKTLAEEWIPTLSKTDKVLLIRSTIGSDQLERNLAIMNISYETACIYETVTDERRKEELNRLYPQLDYVVIASGSAARAYAQMLEQPDGNVSVVAIGPETQKVCQEVGIEVKVTAQKHDAQGIAEAILADVQQKQ